MLDETNGAVRVVGRKAGRGIVLSAIAGIVVGWILSFLYSPLCHWIPIIYINLLVTLALGYLVGSTCRGVIRRRRIDNAGLATVAGLVAGLATWWLCWISYFWVLVGYDFEVYWALLFTPSEMPELMEMLANDPVWSIGKTPAGPWFYYAAWVVEFLVIVGQSALVPRNFVKEHRLCETCGDWLAPTGDVALFDIANADSSILDAVGRGELDQLPRLPGLPGGSESRSDSWLAASLFSCPNCKDAGAFVTVSHVTLKPAKKKDEMEKSEKVILRLHPISNELEEELFAAPAEEPPAVAEEPPVAVAQPDPRDDDSAEA